MNKFIPKVGDKCYVTHPKGNSDCEILGINGGYVWFKVFNHVCFSFLMAECEFKPKKSPAEIEREEAVNEACKLVDTDNGYGLFRSYDNEKIMRLTIEALIRLGYSNKQQVKPLMTRSEFILICESEMCKTYAIQGGDK